jgi:hypothetical protein
MSVQIDILLESLSEGIEALKHKEGEGPLVIVAPDAQDYEAFKAESRNNDARMIVLLETLYVLVAATLEKHHKE